MAFKTRKDRLILINTTQACGLVEEMLGHAVTSATVINWTREFHLGFQVGGRGKWYIDKNRFMSFLTRGDIHGNKKAPADEDT